MAAKVTRLTHKIAIQLLLVSEGCTICSSCSKWPVRKLLVTPSYKTIRSHLVCVFMYTTIRTRTHMQTHTHTETFSSCL